MTHTFYAAPLSLYSGKLRGYLRWKNLPYREVLATKDIYRSVIIPRIGFPMIPIIVTNDDKTLQDTTDIIDYFEAREPTPSVYPSGPIQKLAALIFELLGDEYLVIAAMHYRWHYNRDYAWAEFGKLQTPDGTPEEQIKAGQNAAKPFMGSVPMLGINDISAPAIEAEYETFLRAFDAHLEHHDFLLGSRPSIGDYGLLGPLYAHNYRDPASGAIMERIAPRVADWARRAHAPQHPLEGTFLSDDTIPETLLPLLSLFAAQHLPLLRDTANHLTAFADGKPAGTEVPRALGMQTMDFKNAKDIPRAILPYSLWMLGRVYDHIDGFDKATRKKAALFLGSFGADALMAPRPYPRVTRKNFKLTLA